MLRCAVVGVLLMLGAIALGVACLAFPLVSAGDFLIDG
jgi:hypothetical protein